MERFTDEKYSPCIKRWLIAAGYNKLLALGEIDENKLTIIEEHINKNRDLIESSTCCYNEDYKKQEKFSFLPGHRATILGIPQKIKNLQQARQSVPKQKKKAVCEGELKKMLIQKLTEYTKKQNISLNCGVISERNLHSFTEDTKIDQKVYKCLFACPFCSKKISVLYKEYWLASNITKHLKVHYDEFKANGGSNIDFEEISIEC